MKTWTKRILAVSAAAAGAGLVLLGIGMGMGGRPGVLFDKNGIHSPYQQTLPYHIKKTQTDAFTSLNIQIDSEADIQILPSGDQNFYVEYLLNGAYDKPVCEVTGHTLSVTQAVSPSSMTGVFGLSLSAFDSPDPKSYLTLYLPEEAVIQNTEIYNDYGSTALSGVHLGTVSIESSYGNVTLKNVTGKTLKLILDEGDLTADTLDADSCSLSSAYGDIILKDASLQETEIEMEYGDLELDSFTSNTLKLVSEDGDVICNEFSCKSADFTLEYGDLDLDAKEPGSLVCQMDFGNARLSLPESMNHYLFDIHMEYGKLILPSNAPMELYHEEDGVVSYRTTTAGSDKNNTIFLTSEEGDVTITQP